MSREVDIKALVSHIVLGNGMDKCRICMGDTAEGQVYLEDTVMTDGDKPVTLAELLEMITGVEVQVQEELPSAICSSCTLSAREAANFMIFCRQATKKWDAMLNLFKDLPAKITTKSLFILVNDKLILVRDDTQKTPSAKIAAEKLPKLLKPKPRIQNKYAKSFPCACPTCGKKFLYAQHLFLHMKESTDLQRACHICAKIMTRDELVLHLNQIHRREPYDCKKCPALFRSSHQYNKHLDQAHAAGACTCGDCGRTFSSSNAYHAHISIHASKTCPGCDTQFRNQTCYQYHVKECCNLDKNRLDAFKTKRRVTVEVKNKKSKLKVRVGMRGSANEQCFCDYCGKKFARKKFVGAHIQIVHMKNTHRPCIFCGKLLAAAHMTEHVKTHESTREYKCELCGIILKTRLGHIQHMRLHTGEKPYTCEQCGEKFSASSRRSEHIRRVHKSETVLRHACKLCPARFQLPYKLRKHVATVHEQVEGLALFECNECHEKFSSCRGLLHHSRKHQKLAQRTSKFDFKVYSQDVGQYNEPETT